MSGGSNDWGGDGLVVDDGESPATSASLGGITGTSHVTASGTVGWQDVVTPTSVEGGAERKLESDED